MSLYSSSYLKSVSRNKSFSAQSRILTESRKTHTDFDIFLSHSFLDKDEVEGLYVELTNLGYSVYVDWIVDPHLDRSNVTKDSAALVRKRLKMSRSLLLAVSLNAAMSKWMPWELGFVDGNTNKCAIVPVSRDAVPPKTYQGVEYLKLYPYLKRAVVSFKDDIFIVESSQSYESINNWIRNLKTPTMNPLAVNIDTL